MTKFVQKLVMVIGFISLAHAAYSAAQRKLKDEDFRQFSFN